MAKPTQEEIMKAYMQVFKSNNGQIILNDLASRFFMYSSTLSADSNEMAFREGQRSVLLFLNNTLKDRITQETAIEE